MAPLERDGKPTLIPGAKEFLDYADGLGVSIRYISDRSDEQKTYTMDTLSELGLPQISLRPFCCWVLQRQSAANWLALITRSF